MPSAVVGWLRTVGFGCAALLLFGSAPALADMLAGWDVHGQAGGSGNFGASPLAPTTTSANITVGGLTRGSGISTSGTGAARGWGGADWQNTSESSAVSGGDYVTFTVTPNSGYSTSFSAISHFDYRRSASGAASGTLQYQVGTGGSFVDVGSLSYSANTSSGGSLPAIDLSGIAALQNVPGGTTVTFRIVNWGGTSSSGTWYVLDVANTTASDFEISGSTVQGTAPVNGACGSANGQTLTAAPTTNLCSVGTASSVAGTGPWTGTCAGSSGGSTASCSANLSSAQPFTVFHMNDVHARLTPHKWIAAQHGSGPDVFEDVGGAAYLAGELLSLVKNDPTALVLDGGDISEGSPIGDMNWDVGFSRELDVTAFDGIIQSVKVNGQPIGLSTVYKVAVNNYMLAHPSGGYAWPPTIAAESDPSGILVRDSLPEFMRTLHGTPGTAYSVGGDRYHLNGQYSGGFQAVVTMMNDADSKPTFDDAFIRLLSATPETLSRRGSKQVPTSIVNSDGSVVANNRLSEQELYRSFLGFTTGALVPGDIIQVLGKASFFGGDPEFVDQEGVYGDGLEFKILGHDASLAKPAFMASIDAFLNDNYKNHYVKFLARKVASDTVADQNGASLKIWNKTGYTAASLPGNVGDTLELTGVPTMESFAFRFRSDSAVVSSKSLPTGAQVTSHVDALSAVSSQPITLTATALVSGGGYALAPVADAEVASGSASSNFGTNSNIFIQGTTATGTFGIERGWLKFDLSSIPTGSTISSAILQMWNWKSTGPALPVEARGSATDTWTETGITWNSQPALGSVLDTQTLASGVTNAWYYWNLTSLAQSQLNGDKTLSVVVKSVDESQTGGPSYGFDTKEFGSNAPVLRVTIQSTASAVASVSYFYRFSSDNSTWGAWTAAGSASTTAPYSLVYNFPNGVGYYEFYSVATDNLGNTEAAPAYAQSAVHYTTATGSTQTITFGSVPSTPVGSSVSLSATASSGLPVSYTSQTPAICSLNGSQVTTLAVGSCTIAADQAGDVGYYLAAPTVRSTFQVTGMPQSITFSDFGPLTVGGTATLSATATSNLAVTFTSQTTSVCTVSGNTLTAVAVGTCTVNATQPGDGAYWSAAPTVSKSTTVSNSGGGGGTTPQTINLPVLSDQLLSAGHVSVSVSATASSGLTVTFASQTSSVCTVSGSVVTLVAVGTCTIVASQVGNATYAAARQLRAHSR